MSDLWSLITIVGPILLGGVILWALLRNKADTKGEARTEAATKRLYEEQDAADKARDDRVER